MNKWKKALLLFVFTMVCAPLLSFLITKYQFKYGLYPISHVVVEDHGVVPLVPSFWIGYIVNSVFLFLFIPAMYFVGKVVMEFVQVLRQQRSNPR